MAAVAIYAVRRYRRNATRMPGFVELMESGEKLPFKSTISSGKP